MRVLLTGASGFIGGHAAARLRLMPNTEVVTVARKRAETGERFSVLGDIADPAVCRKAVADIDVVVHIAGLGLARMHESPTFNVVSTQLLAQSCAELETPLFVFLSSIKAGDHGGAYGVSKLRGEQIVERELPVGRWAILRAPLVYGSGCESLRPLLRMSEHGLLPLMCAGRERRFSVVYVVDLVNAIASVVSGKASATAPVPVTHERVATWNAFVEALAASGGRRAPRLVLPQAACRRGAYAVASVIDRHDEHGLRERIADIFDRDWTCSAEDSDRLYGIRCATELQDGLAAMWRWHRNTR